MLIGFELLPMMLKNMTLLRTDMYYCNVDTTWNREDRVLHILPSLTLEVIEEMHYRDISIAFAWGIWEVGIVWSRP